MTKRAKTLTPIFVAERKSWRLSIPATIAPSGRREQRFFKTKTAAEIEAERLRSAARRWGTEGRQIRADLATDAAKAAAMLEGAGLDVTLARLARDHIEAQRKREASVLFAEAWAIFIESREHLSNSHQRTLDRIGRKILPAFEKSNLRDLDAERIERELSNQFLAASSFNLSLRAISPCFALAKRKNWIDENPCSRIPKRETGRAGPISVLSVEEARAVISACRDWTADLSINPNWRVDASDALAAVCVQLFAGVRPAEVERLSWEDFDLGEGTIFVSNQKAKTDRSREIQMPATLRDWLEFVAPPEPRTGSVCPANWKRKMQVIRMKAGIASTGRDQLRKSFASYHLREFGDVNLTRSILGHETSEILFTNYRAAVRRRDAAQFWQIRPPSESAEKIFA